MKHYNVSKLSDLSDLFCAIIGGKPESLEEIDWFLQKNPLNQLLSKNDVEKVIEYGGYFAEEQIDSVYALLPVEINLKNQKFILYPQELRRLNYASSLQAGSRIVNISFDKAFVILINHFNNKIQRIIARKNEIQNGLTNTEPHTANFNETNVISQKDMDSTAQRNNLQNQPESPESNTSKKRSKISSYQRSLAYQRNRQTMKNKEFQEQVEKDIKQKEREEKLEKLWQERETFEKKKEKESEELEKKKQEQEALKKKQEPQTPKKKRKSSYNPDAYQHKLAAMSEEELSALRAKHAEQMRIYRREHPEKIKSYYVKYENLSEEEREEKRAGNRRRNEKYRANHKSLISQKFKDRRAKLKAENPELLKAMDKQNNAKANRKKICNTYYQKHKEEINQKARENPKVKLYKKRYEIKQRLKKTGPVLISLLQGIIANKNGR